MHDASSTSRRGSARRLDRGCKVLGRQGSRIRDSTVNGRHITSFRGTIPCPLFAIEGIGVAFARHHGKATDTSTRRVPEIDIVVVAIRRASVATGASRSGCSRGTHVFLALLLKCSSKKEGSSGRIAIVVFHGTDCEMKDPNGAEES